MVTLGILIGGVIALVFGSIGIIIGGSRVSKIADSDPLEFVTNKVRKSRAYTTGKKRPKVKDDDDAVNTEKRKVYGVQADSDDAVF